MSKIIFAGGIHGVGKSTLCREVASTLSINYLSASEVLSWGEINEDPKNKKVVNIPDTQRRLLEGLSAIVHPDRTYLLDGHYCLFDKSGEAAAVPISIFEQIQPQSLIIVTRAIADIKAALEKRDGRRYDEIKLATLQEKEVAYAQDVAKHLRIPIFLFEQQTTPKDHLIIEINESLT